MWMNNWFMVLIGKLIKHWLLRQEYYKRRGIIAIGFQRVVNEGTLTEDRMFGIHIYFKNKQ